MTTIDTVTAILAPVNADERVATTYTASAHRTDNSIVVVNSAQITVEGDDDAESSAYAQQEQSDRVMTAAMEAAGYTMIDAGADGSRAGYWSTWRKDPGFVWCETQSWTVSDDVGGRWPETITAPDASAALDAAEAQVRASVASYDGADTVRITVADDEGSESRTVTL